MKKIYFLIICFFIFTFNVSANERQTVTLNKCIDGDTAWFNLNSENLKFRLLAINTPESTSKIENYGLEASRFTCKQLKKAKKIEIEYDENSDKVDKYGRNLAWVFVDDNLLQELIIEKGLGEIKYIYGDYKYISILKEKQKKAQKQKINIWSSTKKISPLNKIYYIVFFIIVLLILSLCLKIIKFSIIKFNIKRKKKNIKYKLKKL